MKRMQLMSCLNLTRRPLSAFRISEKYRTTSPFALSSELVHEAELNLANKAALRDERIMTMIADIASVRTRDQIDNLTIRLAPYQKEIQDEVSKNPVYRDCVVTDRVFVNANTSRDVVNASIGPGNTGRAGRESGTPK